MPDDPLEIAPYEFRAGDLVRESAPIKWVVDGLLAEETLVFIAGHPKRARKSHLAMGWGLSVARGVPFLGMRTHQMPVLYFFLEDGRRRVARRLDQHGVTPGSDVPFTCIINNWYQARETILKTLQVPTLVILDTWAMIEAKLGVEDENNNVETTRALDDLRQLCHKTGCTFLIVHHFAKGSGKMRGASAIEGSSDGWIEVSSRGGDYLCLDTTLRDSQVNQLGAEMNFLTGEEGRTRVSLRSVSVDDLPPEPKRPGAPGRAPRAPSDTVTLADMILDELEGSPPRGARWTVPTLEDALKAKGVTKTRQAYFNAVKKLVVDLKISKFNDGYELVSEPEQQSSALEAFDFGQDDNHA